MKATIKSKIETLENEQKVTIEAFNELATDINNKTNTRIDKEKYLIGLANQLAAYRECLELIEKDGDDSKILEFEKENTINEA